MAEELTPETPEESEEPIKQRKNGLYPGVSDELAESMKSGWADTELHDLQPIAQGIAPNADIPPWDGDRFDMVWVFTSDTGPDGFNFTQIPQLLLPGDISDPIVRKKKAEGAP